MDKVKLLNKLSENHNEWCLIVKSFGIFDGYEDIVQDMYLRIYTFKVSKNIVVSNKVNKAYIWITLRNLCYSELKKQKKYTVLKISEINENELQQLDGINYNFKELFDEEVNSWDWYDKMLFKVSYEYSGRKISRESGISLESVFSTLKKCKNKLRVKLTEDYKNYQL
jgi:DNA-directed RNA polymerase specialized sigma24 family protein